MPLTRKALLKSLAGLAAAGGLSWPADAPGLGLDLAPGFWERIRKAK